MTQKLNWRSGFALLVVLLFTATGPAMAQGGVNQTQFHVSPELFPFDSCLTLEQELKTHLSDEMEARINGTYWDWDWGWAEPGAADDVALESSDAAMGDGGAAPRVEGEDFSGTNNQESGVDEADIVKTDGYHIYILDTRYDWWNQQSLGYLQIFGVPEFGDLTYEAAHPIEGHPRAMLLDGDRLVVFSNIYLYSLEEDDPLRDLIQVEQDQWGYWYYRVYSLTKITVLDISDRSDPHTIQELYIEGSYNTAREVDGTVRVVSHGSIDAHGLTYWVDLPQEYYDLDYDDPQREVIYNETVNETIDANDAIIDNMTVDDFVPRIYEKVDSGTIANHPFATGDCSNFVRPGDGMGRSITSIITMDLGQSDFSFEADHILSQNPVVYSSATTLVLADNAWSWWWDRDSETNIHAFDISSPGETTYIASGRINGTVLDQFAISEYNGDIRLASTTGWQDENHVWVLRDNGSALETIGHLGGIAPGERIWSARFVEDEAYLVTFRTIDPLWTIDLSDPTNPVIKGELEIEGVSTYIHPISDNELLTIGFGGDENGLDWSTQVSMFDISDRENPEVAGTLPITPVDDPEDERWSWSWSEATWEHKAFQYWAPKGLLAVPLSTVGYDYNEWTGNYRYDFVSKLMLVEVDPEAEEPVTLYGEVDHSAFYKDNGRVWWWNSGTEVRRSIFMGEYVYAISLNGITVHGIEDGVQLRASAAFATEPTEVWYADDGLSVGEAVMIGGLVAALLVIAVVGYLFARRSLPRHELSEFE